MPSERNTLFPVFLKLEQLHTVLIGAGAVGHEKLSALLNNSPEARVTIISAAVSEEVIQLVEQYPLVKVIKKSYEAVDLEQADLVIASTNDGALNEQIRQDANQLKLLVNVADQPMLCDFYLGSIVQKGQLKIAISTNGQSPTMAKRLKEVLQGYLPDGLEISLGQLNALRNSLEGDFKAKVDQLNAATAVLVDPVAPKTNKPNFKWLVWLSIVFSLGILLTVFWYKEPEFRTYVTTVDPIFYWFLIGGFVFAMVDGSIGMSYGVTSTAFSLSMGIGPAAASMAVHLSEILSNGIAGWMHYRMGNINWKLFRLLIIPGIIGAVFGAYLLSSLEHYSAYTKVLVSVYTLILGWVILSKAFKTGKKKSSEKIKKIRFLGLFGGFIDAVGGGGWGSIVLSSLIAGGRSPRFSLGTVKITRFFIAMMSSLTFVTMLNWANWEAVLGLVVGSALAAPIAARVSNKISVKTIMVAVGAIVILVSLRSIILIILK
ncbi:MAG: siroheme synthase [Pedobacter sp.]|nr:MAG: siroheme synthase [Pedobacter sp.]